MMFKFTEISSYWSAMDQIFYNYTHSLSLSVVTHTHSHIQVWPKSLSSNLSSVQCITLWTDIDGTEFNRISKQVTKGASLQTTYFIIIYFNTICWKHTHFPEPHQTRTHCYLSKSSNEFMLMLELLLLPHCPILNCSNQNYSFSVITLPYHKCFTF